MKTCERESDRKTYELLMGCIERLLSKSMMKRNRQQQVASSSKPDSGIATLAFKGKGQGATGGRDPAGYGATWGAIGQPCFAYQTNSCQRGDRCRYQRSTISQEEYQKLTKKGEEALTQRKATDTSPGKGARSRSNSPKVGDSFDRVCRS